MPHILIVEARFYDHIADHLKAGAVAALEAAGVSYDVLDVPGALEIPAAIRFSAGCGRYDAFVALGCVIRGETSHYDIVAGESARALMDLGLRDRLCIGNGIITCENEAQALHRADPARKNKGRDAALAALRLYEIQRQAALHE
ncbi:MAG: 6,7-dimethyl-8-ribityllumazine synthase [Alphaproteobacteria bacterium]|nr:6,7-dimethyl-8-ribityllumazine synthase [Alphaproteobacteria bacterium]